MTEELKNQTWAVIPPEAREEARREYDFYCRRRANEAVNALGNIFGHHNLTSDTEPEEMLMVSKSKVMKRIRYLYSHPAHIAAHKADERASELRSLFGDQYLSDTPNTPNSGELKPQSVEGQPKFKVGDFALVTDGYAKGSVITIKAINVEPPISYKSDLRDDGMAQWFLESQLEPHTETETKDMEEKELNLCELLKGCEGEKFYSRAYGEVTLNEIVRDDRPNSQEIKVYTPDPQSDRVWFLRNGRKHKNGEIDLYPSRALYEKYPLDPVKAWEVWASEKKPKYILQAEIRLISNDGKTIEDSENVEVEVSDVDLTQAAEAVRETLMKFHEKNAEQ